MLAFFMPDFQVSDIFDFKELHRALLSKYSKFIKNIYFSFWLYGI